MKIMKKPSAVISSAALALTTLTALAAPASAVSAPFAVSAKFCSNNDYAEVSVLRYAPYSAEALADSDYHETYAKIYDGNTDTGLSYGAYASNSYYGTSVEMDLSGISDPKVKIVINGTELPEVYEFTDIYTPYAGGNGTEADPFRIANAAQLQSMSCHEYPVKYDPATLDENVQRFKLMNNIDLSSYSEILEWMPIGFGNSDMDTRFRGRLLGNGKTISNLTAYLPGMENVGLFSEIRAGEVENFNIENFEITGLSRVGALAGKTYGATIDDINISDSTLTGLDRVGGAVGEGDRGHITNYNVDVTVHPILRQYQRAYSFGGLIGEAEYQTIRKGTSKVVFRVDPNSVGVLNADSDPIIENSEISQAGGVLGVLDDGSDIRDIVAHSDFEFDGLAKLQYFGSLVGESDMGAILNAVTKFKMNLTDIGRVDATTGLVGYPEKLSIYGVQASGEINIETDSAGYIGGAFGNFYEAATVMDIHTDIDLNVSTSTAFEISAIAGVLQKSRIQHSVFAGDTKIVLTGCSGYDYIGIFAGRQQSHGGFNKVVVAGAFEVDNQANCDINPSTSFGSIQVSEPPMFRDSYWASEKVSDNLVSGYGFGEGVTNKQLASEKFWASQGFDMVNDFAINSKGQLVPRAAIPAVDESQAGPAGRIAFGKLLKSGKRSYNVNLENKFAGKNATVRVVRNGAKKVIKKVVLSALGNAMFKSKFALQSGDQLQVVISGKRIVNYTVR